MKKTLILSAFLAAFAFAGCNKAEKVAPAAAETRTVSFQAVSQDTKAAFTSPNGNEYPVLWTENTQVAVVQNYDDATNVDVTAISGDKKTASFEAELKTGAEENELIAVIPASSVRSVNSTNKTLNIEIPAAQTSSLTSPDEDAMVLYAKESLDGTIPASVNLTFQHFSAYLHLTFSNYADALTAAGASVQAVSITSAKEIAGRAFFYPETGKVSANAMFKTVTVNTATLENVWAGLVPVNFSGETLTLVVNTDKGTMTRNITFPDGRNLTSGKVANIPVDMSGISLIEPVVYKLVTSENQLHVGDKVIVAAANYDVAISTTQNNNNRATTGITKGDGVILDPGAAVEVITLEDGVKPGEYALKAGAGYLYAASLTGSGNYLRTAAADDITPELAKYGSWDISIFDTVQQDNNSEKTETQNAAKVIAKAASQGLLRYNGDYNLFSAYPDNHGSTYLIHLYRLDKPADETPRFKATMPDADSDNKVTASSAGGELEVYVFGNSAWTASVTGGATLSETSGTGNAILTLSVPENTSTTDTKSYTVTVSTTAEVATKSYSFTVTQSTASSGDGPKVGDVLWEEWWTGGVNNQLPSAYSESDKKTTVVYGGGTVTYSESPNTDSPTQLKNDGVVYYKATPTTWPNLNYQYNLLIRPKNGYFMASGIPCAGVKKATLTYRSNYNTNNNMLESNTVDVTLGSLSYTSFTREDNDGTSYTLTCEISIGSNVNNLDLKFINKNSKSTNIRVDGIELVVTEVW